MSSKPISHHSKAQEHHFILELIISFANFKNPGSYKSRDRLCSPLLASSKGLSRINPSGAVELFLGRRNVLADIKDVRVIGNTNPANSHVRYVGAG